MGIPFLGDVMVLLTASDPLESVKQGNCCHSAFSGHHAHLLIFMIPSLFPDISGGPWPSC